MPLTQDRMIALIDAANSLITNHTELTKWVDSRHSQLSARAREGDLIDWKNEFAILVANIRRFLPSYEAVQTIGKEEGHFNARRKRNSQTAERMRFVRARRREQDTETQFTNSDPGFAALNAALDTVPNQTTDLSTIRQAILAAWEKRGEAATLDVVYDLVPLFTSLGYSGESQQRAIVDQLEAEKFLILDHGTSYTVSTPTS